MRIVRPGSVVGPQQQYMYLKQLEWAKWAAMDEIKRSQAAEAAPAENVKTPVTPPAESDEEMNGRAVTPPMNTVSLPPVTPSRHVALAAAKAKAIPAPGQPRKTPKGKRIADVLDNEEDEEDDVLPALDLAPVVMKKARTSNPRSITSSEQISRVTRSGMEKPSNVRKVPAVTRAPDSPVKATRQAPNRIPRLAPSSSRPVTRAAANAQAPTTRATRQNTAVAAIPSRLPTLAPSRKHQPNLSDSSNPTASPAAKKKAAGTAADAWVNDNPAAVVIPATKAGGRPGLRPIRRRRSSFSNADVVA